MGVVLWLLLLFPAVFAQQDGCFSGGSIAGAVIGSFLAALLLVLALYYLRKLYQKRRRGKHLVLSTDPENVKDEFAFDNAGFQADGRAKTQVWQHEAPTLPLGGKLNGGKASALDAEFTKHITSSKDDLHSEKLPTQTIQLWARDFAGLGFTAEGGAREGVRVHSVLRNGPAAAAGIQPGDKIRSVKISLIGCVLEDAVQILSLASPYPVELEVEGAGVGWRRGGRGVAVRHPLLRAGSTGDVNSLEREARRVHPPHSPNTSHSNNSTLETKSKGIKKIITEKIITTTLERAKKEKERNSTLERENEKNVKIAKNRHSEPIMNKPERVRSANISSEVQIIQPDNSGMRVEHVEVQKREHDPKRGMKFGIRVLPPNVPDDGIIKKNGDISAEKKAIDEPDKVVRHDIKHEIEVEKKPIVAKRREKAAPPVPNVRNSIKPVETDSDNSYNNSKLSEQSTASTFLRDDMNSSGIRRDENGIPQELPQHMLEAAMFARNNRKSIPNLDETDIKNDADKPSKKVKGKAPSPPEEKNKTDDSIVEQLRNVDMFLNNEKLHSSLLHDMSTEDYISYNTSTPKNNKTKTADESINFSQDDIDDIVSKPFRKESDSLNNFYEDTKSNLSSNLDIHSVVSLNNSDKGSTTIELNNSDITIHSSPTNETLQSISDEASILDENERKATSLGDLSRFEIRGNRNTSQGTLERAQSLDISADDVEGEKIKSPKRKSKSVVESNFFDSSNVENLSEMIESETIIIKSKEPRLSLNLAKTPGMEGLSTFQRNRLKKGSEFGNLEDAIVKGSNSSLDSDKDELNEQKNKDYGVNLHHQDTEVSKLQSKLEKDDEETSDHLAKKIMDENMRIHFKLVSEFAKSTSDSSNYSSMDNEPRSDIMYTAQPVTTDFPNSLSLTYDTNIPDDVKVSRHSLVNSLERPKSDMMKKLLAKNPALNVHIDQIKDDDLDTPKTSRHQPDIVNFNMKTNEPKQTDDFVSNIRIGSNNNSLTYNKGDINWSDKHTNTEQQSNIVTITTERTKSPSKENTTNHTKSIEISNKMVPDIIEEVNRNLNKPDESHKVTTSKTYFSKEPHHMKSTSIEEPVQKTVTVNVAEDEFGNRVIKQNIEQISTKYITEKTEAPLQIEQVTFGIIKNPNEIERLAMEEGDNIKDIDEVILQEIKKQNPDIHFTSDEPAYSKTETIILNTNLDEANALALMDKLKNDPVFMSQKTPEELSQMGVTVIHDLEDKKQQDNSHIEVTKTRYSINPSKIPTKHSETNDEEGLTQAITADDRSVKNKNHITEIQVMTPRSEKLLKQKSDVERKVKPKERSSSYSEPATSYELDLSLLNDFISNERRHSAMEHADKRNRTRKLPKPETKSPTHSDYDLPRNSQIKFRTATYESPKGTIITSTDVENKRLSQMDQESRVKPMLSAKPSNIPVKMPEKQAKSLVSPSKIPVFMSQKSLSQENLSDKGLSLPKSPPPKLSSSTTNISVTSIKSSSKNPSGK